ncbi:MAG: c-type cytochrome [Hyphomicrobiales bacterium]
MTDVEAQALGSVLLECSSCHAFEPDRNTDAPTLHGVFGRDIGGASYAYSDALAGMDGTWNRETLIAYLEDPNGFASGTTMPAIEFSNREQIIKLVYLLETID